MRPRLPWSTSPVTVGSWAASRHSAIGAANGVTNHAGQGLRLGAKARVRNLNTKSWNVSIGNSAVYHAAAPPTVEAGHLSSAISYKVAL